MRQMSHLTLLPPVPFPFSPLPSFLAFFTSLKPPEIIHYAAEIPPTFYAAMHFRIKVGDEFHEIKFQSRTIIRTPCTSSGTSRGHVSPDHRHLTLESSSVSGFSLLTTSGAAHLGGSRLQLARPRLQAHSQVWRRCCCNSKVTRW